MGHVVNPVSFRLGTVKMWNSSIFSDHSSLKYNGYFAVVSYNIYYFLSKLFRSRFFTYVTSFIFSHIKLFWKFNKILCFIFLFNGATEIGGYKNTSLISFFFSNQKKTFKKLKRNIMEIKNKSKITIFPSKFFFETGFSYNFFYKMWLNKKLRYYGIYKPIMIDQIKRDGYYFLFKTKVSPESSTFERFLFKHMMYKRKELRKKWNKINHSKIKIKKNFRKYLIRKFLKYIYYISLKENPSSDIRDMLSIQSLVSFKRNKKLRRFKKISKRFGRKILKKLIGSEFRRKFYYDESGFSYKVQNMFRDKYKAYVYKILKRRKSKRFVKFMVEFLKKRNKEKPQRKTKKYKLKIKKINEIIKKKRFKPFPRGYTGIKRQNFLFEEILYRSKKTRLKRRTYIINTYNRFKFFLNKFIKKLKYNIYKLFFKKTINSFCIINNIYIKFKKLMKNTIYKNKNFFYFLITVFLVKKKQSILFLFNRGFKNIIKNKFKIDLFFAKISAYNLEIGLLKYNSWNVQEKLKKILSNVFRGFKFKMQFHFLNIKNINAKIISYYIAVRLKQKYRIGPIIKDVKKYCSAAKEVRGWKLTCAGRFSKKEIAAYIVQKGGSFGYSSITSLLDYSFNSVILKYSICGIKVWFVLKKNFKKITSFKFSFAKIIIQKIIKEKKKKLILFFKNLKNEYKNNNNIENFDLLFIKKSFLYFNYKSFYYKRFYKNSYGFWAIWRVFFKKYKFVF